MSSAGFRLGWVRQGAWAPERLTLLPLISQEARDLWRRLVAREATKTILASVLKHVSQGKDWDLFEKALLAFHDLLKVMSVPDGSALGDTYMAAGL
eukprot:scaffold2765_cov328-Prasinococcus_capsulatus_cf.AAC.6